jgi:hypothetical protein
MYKKILGKIRELFFTEQRYDTSLRRQCILEEYKDIYVKTRESNTLTDLLHSKKLIKDFQLAVVDMKEESWARPYLVDLTRVWKVKYNIWKRNRSK